MRPQAQPVASNKAIGGAAACICIAMDNDKALGGRMDIIEITGREWHSSKLSTAPKYG